MRLNIFASFLDDDEKDNIKLAQVVPNCPKEDYAPEGEPLYAIVDDYAKNQQKWFDDFIAIMHKMSSNGYEDSDLKTNSFDFKGILYDQTKNVK